MSTAIRRDRRPPTTYENQEQEMAYGKPITRRQTRITRSTAAVRAERARSARGRETESNPTRPTRRIMAPATAPTADVCDPADAEVLPNTDVLADDELEIDQDEDEIVDMGPRVLSLSRRQGLPFPTMPPRERQTRTRAGSSVPARAVVDAPQPRSWPPRFWRLKLGFGLAATMLVLYLLVSLVLAAINAVTNFSNTLQYGPVRTTVVSGVFGHDHDSAVHPTLVIAQNLQGTIDLREVPASDQTKEVGYPTGLSLIGEQASQVPVQLTIKDLNNDHLPDVLIHIQGGGQDIMLKLLNTGSGFRLVK